MQVFSSFQVLQAKFRKPLPKPGWDNPYMSPSEMGIKSGISRRYSRLAFQVAAVQLRKAGWTLKAIGLHLHYSTSAIYKMVYPYFHRKMEVAEWLGYNPWTSEIESEEEAEPG